MRPTTSAPRRWCMLSLLMVLVTLIGGYAFLTNSSRVRKMAESYLSQMLGGQVQVRKATLSIFEGLKLEDVRVRLAGESLDTPPIFSADTFVVRYSLHKLLAGRIEATQIIAKRPHVQLTEDLDSLLGSYRKVVRDKPNGDAPLSSTIPRKPPPLPEISLRDARVDYREQRPDGTTSFGTLSLEGQFSPTEGGDRYEFTLQTRGMSERMGFDVQGSIVPSVGRIAATLRNFELGSDIRLMLPATVRQWWEQHELAGKFDVVDLSYVLPRPGQTDAKFTVKTAMQGVTLVIQPGELMSTDESARIASVRDTIATMAGVYRLAGHTGLGPMTPIELLLASAPIRLDDMAGTFTFTEGGIAIENAHGDIEGNRIYIDGKVDGYPGRVGVPEPPALLRITSGDGKLTLPPTPAYTNSLPRAVREIYDQLRPQGSCTMDVKVERPDAGGKLVVDGAINILDGKFTFIRFPYPVRNATGRISFAPADASAPERLELNLTGQGIAGGPNEKTIVNVTGLMGPLGNDAGVAIRISSDDVHTEDAMTIAFPAEVQKALKLFDADGKGDLPRFHGRFTCDVNRAIGPMQPWLLSTHVVIDSAKGKLEAFPYPVEGMAVELKIGEDHVDIINANVAKADATLRVDGRVSWGPRIPVKPGETRRARSTIQPTTVTNLTLQARNLPVDKDLLDALPPDKRQWLDTVGISGKLDIDGTVRSDPRAQLKLVLPTDEIALPPSASSPASPMVFDLDVTLRDGTVWPADGSFAIGEVAGRMKLSPDRIELIDVTGKRGAATLKAIGKVNFPQAPLPGATVAPVDAANEVATLDLAVSADNLLLDAPLYTILPRAAQESWDELRPHGTLDIEVVTTGPLHEPPALSPALPTTRPVKQTRVVLKPRKLSVFPKTFPYKLDDLTGRIVIADGKTTLHQVTGRHGDGQLSVWGSSETIADSDVWAVTLFARDVTVDDALINAMPRSLAESLRSMELKGKVGWYLPRFVYSSPRGSGSDTSKATIDLSGKLTLAGTDMNVGVELTDVRGGVSGRATVTAGEIRDLHGTIELDSLSIADRAMSDFHAAIDRDAGSDQLRLTKMSAQLAGGDLAGAVTLTSPVKGPGQFSIDLVLRDADIRTIAQLDKAELKGRLSASLALEGTAGDPKSRRGRGDVLATGKDMYDLPVVMGLLQITNLALPISSPFNTASARYSIDGPRINFESIDLRSNTMAMQGNGHLDFDTRKVALTFTTDNPNAPRIPFISDLWRNAQQELFKIEVRGTVQDPKVSTATFGTFSTTVDEVFGAKQKR